MAAVKLMVCVNCAARIRATIPEARRHGWHFWVGGARCRGCLEEGPPTEAAPAQVAEAPPQPQPHRTRRRSRKGETTC